jgi:hypothetical protein
MIERGSDPERSLPVRTIRGGVGGRELREFWRRSPSGCLVWAACGRTAMIAY